MKYQKQYAINYNWHTNAGAYLKLCNPYLAGNGKKHCARNNIFQFYRIAHRLQTGVSRRSTAKKNNSPGF